MSITYAAVNNTSLVPQGSLLLDLDDTLFHKA